MVCPVCKGHEHTDINLHVDQFDEELMKCPTCGSMWSINHGAIEIVKDTQENSFLSALSECVEGDDYSLVA